MTSADLLKNRLIYVLTERGDVAGHVLSRGVAGYEAFGIDDHSLGLFPTQAAAAAALLEPVRP